MSAFKCTFEQQKCPDIGRERTYLICPQAPSLLVYLDGTSGMKNESIAKIKQGPERCEFQLSNAPKNVDNARILGKNELLYDVVAGGGRGAVRGTKRFGEVLRGTKSGQTSP